MEMSGLVPDRDRILEVAMVVTDADLNTIAEAPVYVLHQSDEVLDANGRVDPHRLKTIARLGGDWYARTSDLFEMKRPT